MIDELIERVEKGEDPMAPKHRCRDFDEDCAEVPGITPDGQMRSHLSCWLHNPTQGWCPFLRAHKEQHDGR